MNSELKYQTEDIKSIFLELIDIHNIKYCLLSEYFGAIGGDIDIYIYPSSQNDFKMLLKKDDFFYQKYSPAYENHYFYYFKKDGYRALKVDVKYELSFYDKTDNVYRIFDFDIKLIDEGLHKTIYGNIAKYYHSVIFYAAKCAFVEKQKLELRQINALKNYIESFVSKISDTKEKTIIQELYRVVETIDDIDRVSLEIRVILLPFFMQKLTGKTLFKRMVARIKRIGNSKFSILFLGSDGSGKTTTIEYIKKELDIPMVSIYGGVGKDGWIFSSLYKLRENNKKSSFIKKVIINKLFLYFLYPLDLFARKLRIIVSGNHRLLLIDRCPELLINNKLTKYLHKYIFPTPNIIVLLKASPEVLVSRKPTELDNNLAKIKLANESNLAKYYEKDNIILMEIDTSIESVNNAKQMIESEIWKLKEFKESLFKKGYFK
jgi:hypothetical protein